MRIAYIISAYRNPAQVVRLVQRLASAPNVILVHVDRRSPPAVFDVIRTPLEPLPNVRFLPRHSCRWGDFGHVQATLAGIRELVTSGVAYDMLVLLTGQDYPIKPDSMIASTLEQGHGKSFVEWFPLPAPQWALGGLNRIERWHVWPAGHHLTFPPLNGALARLPFRRRFPGGYRPFGGSSYFCLTRRHVEYIAEFVQREPAFVRFFRNAHIPDELFFQTLLLNAPLGDELVNANQHLIDWPPGARSPQLFGPADVERLVTSPKLFARKFDTIADLDVLDRIDERLGISTPGPNVSAS